MLMILLPVATIIILCAITLIHEMYQLRKYNEELNKINETCEKYTERSPKK